MKNVTHRGKLSAQPAADLFRAIKEFPAIAAVRASFGFAFQIRVFDDLEELLFGIIHHKPGGQVQSYRL